MWILWIFARTLPFSALSIDWNSYFFRAFVFPQKCRVFQEYIRELSSNFHNISRDTSKRTISRTIIGEIATTNKILFSVIQRLLMSALIRCQLLIDNLLFGWLLRCLLFSVRVPRNWCCSSSLPLNFSVLYFSLIQRHKWNFDANV